MASRRVPVFTSGFVESVRKIFWIAKNSAYGLKSLNPGSRTKIKITETMSRPLRLTPRCFFINAPPPLYGLTDAPELVEIPPDQERFADDIFVRHEAPVAAVA